MTSSPLVLSVSAAVLVALSSTVAPPAHAARIGAEVLPPQVLVHFDRAETARIARSAHTGFTEFVSTLCLLMPTARRTYPVQAACLVGTGTGYGRLVPIFKDARKRKRCVRVSYPVAFPIPNPAPYSRVEAC